MPGWKWLDKKGEGFRLRQWAADAIETGNPGKGAGWRREMASSRGLVGCAWEPAPTGLRKLTMHFSF